MALRKSIVSPYGDDAPNAHWTVRSIAEEYEREEITIVVVVHSTKAARNQGKEPIATMAFTLTGADYDSFKAIPGGMRQSAYTWLVANRPEFEGAVED